jgi:hypothetical protein
VSKIEREIEQVAEGRDESTPFKALFGVWVIVAVVVVGILILVGVLTWVLAG